MTPILPPLAAGEATAATVRRAERRAGRWAPSYDVANIFLDVAIEDLCCCNE